MFSIYNKEKNRTAMDPDSQEKCALNGSKESMMDRKPSHPPFRTVFLGSVLILFLGTLLALVFLLSREKSTFMALFNPDQIFEEEADEDARLEARKAAILRSLNKDINQETRQIDTEDNRLLTRLDRLWRTVKRYVSPSEVRPPPTQDRVSQRANRNPSRNTKSFAPSQEFELEEVLHHILSLYDESLTTPDKATDQPKNPESIPAEPLVTKNKAWKTPGKGGIGGSRSLDELLYNLEPTGGVRTRGVAWRLHRNLILEGTLDTTQVGQVDGDLSDFGFRSVHALTTLRGMSKPLVMMGYENIDSGYPRSYGIGLNYRLSSSMQMLFDYSHEYPNDHFIEYRGNWESSLLTDYAKKRPEKDDGDLSVHNFFFGLRYLHRMEEALVPMHTGFFYSTNMADESLPSDVSMGFSVGGGYQKNALQMGVSYRLRIWENSEDPFLVELDEEDFSTRMSNQVLFFIAF
jgi:hypothetical protein